MSAVALAWLGKMRRALGGLVAGNEMVADGHRIAEETGDRPGAEAAIERTHQTEAAQFSAELEGIREEMSAVQSKRAEVEAALKRQDYDIGRVLQQSARAKIELKCAGVLLAVSAFLAILTMGMFGPWYLTFPCAVLVLATTLAIEQLIEALEERNSSRITVFLVLSSLGLMSQFWLGAYRADVASVLMGGGEGPTAEVIRRGQNVFALAIGLLGVLGEVIAAVLLHRSKRVLLSPVTKLVRERERLAAEHAALSVEAKRLETQADVNRNFRLMGAHAWLKRQEQIESGKDPKAVRRAVVHAAVIVLLLALLLLIFGPGPASAGPAPKKAVVVLVDVSKSVSPESLEANIGAVGPIVGRLNAGDRLVIIGITDTFSNPLLLIDREMSEEGYLSLLLRAAKEGAIAEWRKKSVTLSPTYSRTDILGAMAFAVLLTGASDREFIIFSDGVQDSVEVSPEKVSVIDADKMVSKVRTLELLPDLSGSKVRFLGVDPRGMSVAYFASLKRFWLQLLSEAGATVVEFTPDRIIRG